jgi:hypothetical protein
MNRWRTPNPSKMPAAALRRRLLNVFSLKAIDIKDVQSNCAGSQLKIQVAFDFADAQDFNVLTLHEDQFPVRGDEQGRKFMFRFHTCITGMLGQR